MERKAVLQKIAKQIDYSFSLAYIYLSVIFTVNDIHVTKRQKQLLAFIATRGISSVSARQDFCSEFKSSQATINNMIGELTEQGLITKENGKHRLIPQLSLDFTSDVVLNIKLSYAHG